MHTWNLYSRDNFVWAETKQYVRRRIYPATRTKADSVQSCMSGASFRLHSSPWVPSGQRGERKRRTKRQRCQLDSTSDWKRLTVASCHKRLQWLLQLSSIELLTCWYWGKKGFDAAGHQLWSGRQQVRWDHPRGTLPWIVDFEEVGSGDPWQPLTAVTYIEFVCPGPPRVTVSGGNRLHIHLVCNPVHLTERNLGNILN